MSWLRTIWEEFFGLFVDDARFAVAILVWLAMAWLVLPRVALPPGIAPAFLFAGLAAILVESAFHRARGSRRG